jgi:RNA polymerase sigma factor for flagellar operon FliA
VKDDKELWRRYRQTKDQAIKEQLIRKYLYLVKYVAGRMAMKLPSHVDVDDLSSAGVMGFLAALEAYDPEREVDFPTYALNRIRGSILDELRGLDWVPRFVRKKARIVERALAELEQQLKRQPMNEEVAAHLGMSLEEYYETLSEIKGNTLVSLDEGWNDERSEGASIPAQTPKEMNQPDPFMDLALNERRAILAKLIDTLPPQERTVLALYYYDELTMKEIGEALDISESRVSQVHSGAVLRLRARLKRQRIQATDLDLADDAGHPTGSRSSAGRK